MNKKKVKRYLDELTDYFGEHRNDKVALQTYSDDFTAGDLINEIYNVIVDGEDPNDYGYEVI